MVYSALMYYFKHFITKLSENQDFKHFTFFCTKNGIFGHFPKLNKQNITH